MSLTITGVDWPLFKQIDQADSHPMVFGIEGIMVSVRLEKKKEYTDCWRVELLVNRVTTGGQNNPKVNLKPGDLLCGLLYKQEKDGSHGLLEIKNSPCLCE
jgi:hypothetical protein